MNPTARASAIARELVDEGFEVVCADTVHHACETDGTFARGVFDFELPDGSGIVLAAELIMQSRLGSVQFEPVPDTSALEPHARNAPRAASPAEARLE